MKIGFRAKLVLASMGIVAMSTVAADVVLTRRLDADLTERVERDLFIRASLARHTATDARLGGDDLRAWDELADSLGQAAEARLSFIRGDGVVLGDSEVPLPELPQTERHGSRPEVVDALNQGRGASARRSSTVGSRMMYVALPLEGPDAVRVVVRVALPLTEVDAAVGRVRTTVLIGSTIAMLLAIVMSTVAAQLMSRPVRAFTSVARRLSAGDLEARTRAVGNDEVAELGRALDGLASSLFGALDDLRRERDLLGGVLDGMREGVLLVDARGAVVLANPALREMLLLGADVAGKRPLELVRSAELKELIDRVAESGDPDSCEIDVGELKPRRLLVHATSLGKLASTLAVFVDVTDVRRLESMRRDFVANVSHELRTPIATVLSAAETLQSSGISGAQATEFLEIIDRNAHRLHNLVEDLLDLSRIESRELKLTLEPLELRAVVDQIVPLYRERAEHKRVRVVLEALEGARVLADRRALDQVLSNLIDNAIKYTSDGSLVTVTSERSAAQVVVSVTDTGAGIEAKHLPRLFERFYRVDAGRSREVGGTGLGLSIVKNLTEAMGGSVQVESKVGRGSKFSVSLPRAE